MSLSPLAAIRPLPKGNRVIEVTCIPSGDVAHAEDPEAALAAARTLCADDAEHMPILGRERYAEFRVAGVLVRTVRERVLWGQA